MKVKSTRGKIGDWVFVLICALISLICILPMLNLLARSLSGTDYLIRHEVYDFMLAVLVEFARIRV